MKQFNCIDSVDGNKIYITLGPLFKNYKNTVDLFIIRRLFESNAGLKKQSSFV